jgi:septal ring factor EnvC (AmiA/AmiB activator)
LKRITPESKRLGTGLLMSLAMCALIMASGQGPDDDARERRLRSLRDQIERLEGEMFLLEGEAQGVIGELERVGAELRLREAQVREVSARIDETESAIGDREDRLASLQEEQDRRSRYLTFRVREMYMHGPALTLRRVVAEEGDVHALFASLRYAAYLGERDARTLREYRRDAGRLETERGELVSERDRLARVRGEATAARANLRRTRASRTELLDVLERDREKRAIALEELEEASGTLGGLVDRLGAEDGEPLLDMQKFRGLLDWPAPGPVTSRFGRVVHPRFKTVVPHPGLDIDAGEGTDFLTVFQGRVAYASWLRGYGLTAIVDHGGGLMSVYAHASILHVEEGDEVLRGQPLGRVGDTGSLTGPFLYFELRRQGEPVDPEKWLRPR